MTFPNLVHPWRLEKERQYRKYPCRSNRASQLGGDCERELVYWRTRWEEALDPSFELQVVFGEGDKHERAVIRDLQSAGVEVLEQQVSLEWREYQITGHIDFVVPYDGEVVPVDVKSMSSHIWDSTFRRGSGVYEWKEVAEAFTRKSWLRKYLAQVVLYCLMKSVSRSLLLCLNKGTGLIAQVNCELDYDLGEFLIQRAERINRHVEEGTVPERIRFDEEVCPRCPFYHVCLPEHAGKPPIAFLEDETVRELLEERERYEEARGRWEAVDKRLKAWAKAREEPVLSVGEWLVRKKEQRNGTRVLFSRVE